MDDVSMSKVFKALSDTNRLRILRMISGSELCACNILEELNITQPTLSHHMKVLSDAGLVKIRQEGKWSHYSIDDDAIGAILTYLQTFERM